MSEADVTVNGVRLTQAQSMTVRVALNNLLVDVGDAEMKRDLGEIGKGYHDRAIEVLKVMTGAEQKGTE